MVRTGIPYHISEWGVENLPVMVSSEEGGDYNTSVSGEYRELTSDGEW